MAGNSERSQVPLTSSLKQEIERLTRERDTAREALRISESYVRELSEFRLRESRLRAALREIVTMWQDNANDLDFTDEMMHVASEALSGTGPAPETAAKPTREELLELLSALPDLVHDFDGHVPGDHALRLAERAGIARDETAWDAVRKRAGLPEKASEEST